MTKKCKKFSRRDLVTGMTAFGVALGTACHGKTTRAQDDNGKIITDQEPREVSVPVDGDYEKVDLIKPVIRIGVVQSRIRGVDVSQLGKTRQDNLNHMLELIDAANNWGGAKDLLLFHEFPITGYSNKWDRKDALKAAIEIPGEETEAISKKAKEYQCYIVFGSYGKDGDWPNHLLSITSIIGPDGAIVDKHWKARNIKGVFGPGFELFTTTIYDVLDQYVEMYGIDAVIPVTRTPIGNIATSSIQREPELFRRRHSIPMVHIELYRSVFGRYVNRFPPNLFTTYQPENTSDAYRYLLDKQVWK